MNVTLEIGGTAAGPKEETRGDKKETPGKGSLSHFGTLTPKGCDEGGRDLVALHVSAPGSVLLLDGPISRGSDASHRRGVTTSPPG